jgi:pimeloyl-ACP methyl ester carboxylesterase
VRRPTTRVVHQDEPHFITADDGVALTLIRVSGSVAPTRGPVMLVHGAGMRAESFRPPGIRSLVDVLIDDGWDVWLFNWRGSLDLDPLPWTLDDVALYDHPAAVRYVLAQTGASSLKVVAHCQGSTTIAMAVVAGLLPQVRTVVSNGVALHPRVAPFARVKLHVLRPLLQSRQPFLDIAWGDGPEAGLALITRTAVRWWHVECGNPACNMASFALGSGHPALYLHSNLADATHEWLRNEFGKVPMSFYAQLAASDRAGQIVGIRPNPALPHRYAVAAPKSDTRFALFAGEHNRSFLPSSQRATYQYLTRHQPRHHSLHMLKGYGHADVFLGKRAHREVFAKMITELHR